MGKVIVVLFSTLLLASIADFKPISNEETPLAPPSASCIDCVAGQALNRPKRQAVDILGAVGGLVTNVIHEAMVHKQQTRSQAQPDRYEYIGNGRGNTNNITYNVYPNAYRNSHPYPDPYRNPYRNPYSNPYRNPYSNPYSNPYPYYK